MQLRQEHRTYLTGRSYTDQMIDNEEIFSIEEGSSSPFGVDIRTDFPLIGWVCRSVSGELVGISSRRLDVSEYRWHPLPNTTHFPILYAADEDHEILYNTGRMIVCEGVMDRAAIKRCVPDYAVYARLSKGIAKHLLFMVERYCTVLWTAFDQDAPGQAATIKTTQKVSSRVEVNTLRIPVKDPAKLIEDRGEKRAKEIITRQIRELEF